MQAHYRAPLPGSAGSWHGRQHDRQLGGALAAARQVGYCVFAFNYGSSASNPFQGLGAIETSAKQLAAFVDKVRAATGARKVDIVGHSQGGMMPRYYLRFLRGATKVDTLIGLAPSNHGTTFFGLTTLEAGFGASGSDIAGCAACSEQVAGSAFLTKLNAGHETEPGVHYTVIESKYDDVVTPYTSAFLTGADVRNVLLQTGCPFDLGITWRSSMTAGPWP